MSLGALIAQMQRDGTASPSLLAMQRALQPDAEAASEIPSDALALFAYVLDSESTSAASLSFMARHLNATFVDKSETQQEEQRAAPPLISTVPVEAIEPTVFVVGAAESDDKENSNSSGSSKSVGIPVPPPAALRSAQDAVSPRPQKSAVVAASSAVAPVPPTSRALLPQHPADVSAHFDAAPDRRAQQQQQRPASASSTSPAARASVYGAPSSASSSPQQQQRPSSGNTSSLAPPQRGGRRARQIAAARAKDCTFEALAASIFNRGDSGSAASQQQAQNTSDSLRRRPVSPYVLGGGSAAGRRAREDGVSLYTNASINNNSVSSAGVHYSRPASAASSYSRPTVSSTRRVEVAARPLPPSAGPSRPSSAAAVGPQQQQRPGSASSQVGLPPRAGSRTATTSSAAASRPQVAAAIPQRASSMGSTASSHNDGDEDATMTPRIPSLSPSGMPSPISSKLQQGQFVGGVYASQQQQQQQQQKRSLSQPAARPSVYAADDGQSFDDGDDGVDYEDDADFEDDDEDELAPPSSRQQQPHSNRSLHRHIAHGNSLYGDGGAALQDSCYVQRAPSVGAADGGAATGRSSVMSGFSAALSSSTAAAAATAFRPTSGSASWGMRQQTHGAYANVAAFQQRGGSANNSRSATPVINDAAALSRAYGQAAVPRSRPTSAAAIARPPRPSSATARR